MHLSILAALRCMRLSVAMSDRTSLLRELGLPASAMDDDVKRAYRRLAKELHPDVNASADAAERFVRITHAYQTLIEQRQPGDKTASPTHGPAMDARWNIRRRFTPTEYPAWFNPNDGAGRREIHSGTCAHRVRPQPNMSEMRAHVAAAGGARSLSTILPSLPISAFATSGTRSSLGTACAVHHFGRGRQAFVQSRLQSVLGLGIQFSRLAMLRR